MHGLIFLFKLVILLYLKNKKKVNILGSSFKNSKLKGN